jgi:hypothetical protein
MDNGNSAVENKFHRYKEHSRVLTVSGDFENKVFAKIKKKKTQRKVTVSVTLGLVIAAFVFIAQLVLVQKAPEPTLAVQPGISVKEEVPVMEDVIYASSDSRTNYAIGQVAYYEEQDSI